ncbi:MAG: COX15/CtaA family protein [Bythopirellula sp.]|nr:COX15/CtaA family protein [Bythopirellula sp.]
MNAQSHSLSDSRWPHRWAWLLACATFPLIWVGGLVTTTGAGMAFKDWLTSDGHFMLFYPWLDSEGDKFVEHGHRLLGALVGFLAIALVAVCYKWESRSWVRRYSLVILGGVILQGVLGGMRVVFDERTLAMIHGCTGPAFFALCVGMVVVTSRWWQVAAPIPATPGSKKFLRLAILTTPLAYLQLVVGAFVRHSPHLTGDAATVMFHVAVYFHILLALAITVQVGLLSWQAFRASLERGRSLVLACLIGLQVLLGVSTWMVKYGLPRWATAILGDLQFVNTAENAQQAGIVTSHVAVGSLILVTSLAIALRAGRQLRVGLPKLSAPANVRMEAAV